jgi:leucyl/phenylalanyl-tRNA--protein transferase
MMDTYNPLHQLGYGHSIEVWDQEKLVGGLYGLSLGSAFFGESMFSHRPDASKLALVSLAKFSKSSGIDFIDCQLPTDHLASMGAINISRKEYLRILEAALRQQDHTIHWQLED